MPFWKPAHESVEWLSGVAFFDGFTHDDLQQVVALGTEVLAEPGAILMDQGDTGVDCFVIVEGSAAVRVSGEFVATVSAGTMVGEMALVDHRPRNATVVAQSPMKLLRFDAQQFRQLLDQMPKASERVMTLLHDRLLAND
ncbi:MAG: cyclic nucleotide-binding domain-containing protein [Microthrixaceae bacterium]|nr:cyclic nucleotide-binding domain-containing protein [Actinomycetota bacterium]HMT26244.1 cyclic nucleotide-binding domain-containing protein [Microthrixaceae bacterium]HMT62011.1 cyclic nucleotide-binding domain-containing protein [Microthrixaceae bacterium]